MKHVKEQIAVAILCLLAALLLLGSPEASASGRVVGGSKVPEGSSEWGFIVPLLGPADSSAFSSQLCGGSMISPRHVLTAAHCVFYRAEDSCDTAARGPEDVSIATGLTTLPSDNSVLRTSVKSISVHPNYDPCTIDNDIAVIHLADEPLGNFSVIALAVGPSTSPGRIAGWGLSGGPDLVYTGELLEAPVDVPSPEECGEQLGAIPQGSICAGKLGSAQTCFGDSGGPLVQDGVLVGVTSWSVDCSTDWYSGYTSVGLYRDWILAEVGESLQAPEASGLYVTPAKNPSQAVARWSGDAPARGWTVRVVGPKGVVQTRLLSAEKHGVRLKGLTASTTYSVLVSARGSVRAATRASFTTAKDEVPPTRVVGLSGVVMPEGFVRLSWRGGGDKFGTTYVIQEMYGGNWGELVTTNLRTIEVGKYGPGVELFRVYAIDPSGNRSPASKPLSVVFR